MVELLSPAGNLEKLEIALKYGADALYGGVSHFSLRGRASKEFDYESFEEGIKLAHSLGKKVYVTINGFPFESQLELLKNHIKKMATLKPDAFIISTVGVIELAKQIAPEIPLHLSTQANVMNSLDAKVYYNMGVSRIISAREISLNDLKKIKEKVPELEIEVFVHGSMCFAYSGRCLISTIQSGRVPNRGSCANDCRFPYEVYLYNEENNTLFKVEEEGIGSYILNAKDLNLSSHLDLIVDSGVVDSIKIEGRTKSPYYVAVTTKTYREALNDIKNGSFNPKKYEDELNTTKHRGFTDSYLISRPYEKHNTQNLLSAISEGTMQVFAIVEDDGYFLAKDRVAPNEIYEIVSYSDICEVDNEIGKVFRNNEKFFIQFYKIETKNGKLLDSVHSGNTNLIKLPITLPKYSFLRR